MIYPILLGHYAFIDPTLAGKRKVYFAYFDSSHSSQSQDIARTQPTS